jgi:hypothetical protein
LITDYADYAGNFAIVKGYSLGRIGRQEKEKLWQDENSGWPYYLVPITQLVVILL